jgi:hypothetical protein
VKLRRGKQWENADWRQPRTSADAPCMEKNRFGGSGGTSPPLAAEPISSALPGITTGGSYNAAPPRGRRLLSNTCTNVKPVRTCRYPFGGVCAGGGDLVTIAK